MAAVSRDSRGPRRSEMDWRPPGWKYLPKEGIEGWTEAVFFALLEVSVLGFPALLATTAVGPDTVAQSFGATVSLLTLVVGVGTIKSEYDPLDAEWPSLAPSALLVRVVWYNGAVLLAAFAGVAIDGLTIVRLGSFVFAVGVSVLTVATLPSAATRVRSLLSWWTWGRPLP